MYKCVRKILEDSGSDVKCLCEEYRKEHGKKYGIIFPELLINVSRKEDNSVNCASEESGEGVLPVDKEQAPG